MPYSQTCPVFILKRILFLEGILPFTLQHSLDKYKIAAKYTYINQTDLKGFHHMH